MPLIEVDHLVREYKQYTRFKGLLGAFRSLVTQQSTIVRAVDDISFSIERGSNYRI